MRTRLVFLIILCMFVSNWSGAMPVESLTGVQISSCGKNFCYEIKSKTAFGDFRDEYLLENVDIVIKRFKSKIVIKQLHAKTARTDENWKSWIFKLNSGTMLFDTTTGLVE